jgi:small conductance mechanosensitive channel
MENVDLNDVNKYAEQFIRILIDYSPRIISALIVLFIGLWVIKMVRKFLLQFMSKREMEPTLVTFLSDMLNWTLKALLFVTVISRLGVETTSFVALLGAAGLAVGLSLQGSLANIAGGVLIIIFKPFKLGDFIEAQGVMGTVTQIQIFVTRLKTPNNQIIFVPNGSLSNGNITNYSAEGNRRADIDVGISYGSNIKKAKELVFEVMKNNPLVLEEPAPNVIVKELGDSSIDLGVRPWAKNEDFWTMRSNIIEEIKIAFDANGIEIPFPQRDVHIKNS